MANRVTSSKIAELERKLKAKEPVDVIVIWSEDDERLAELDEDDIVIHVTWGDDDLIYTEPHRPEYVL